jgi:amidophosphoribosyltransferase
VYGIDMPSAGELIAHGRSDDEVCQLIGADKLIYQDLEDLVSACQEGNADIEEFDCSVFNGHYLAGNIDGQYLSDLETRRNDDAKKSREKTRALADNEVIDLHNSN